MTFTLVLKSTVVMSSVSLFVSVAVSVQTPLKLQSVTLGLVSSAVGNIDKSGVVAVAAVNASMEAFTLA